MTTRAVTSPSPAQGVPPLRDGDSLSADEFERRYDATPDLSKAELIDGVVHMPPPVSEGHHGTPHFDLIGWLAIYRFATPGILGADNSTLRLDLRNRPQPDAYLRVTPEFGGHTRRDTQGYLTSGPELVAEVSATNVRRDLNVKFDVYRRHRVHEYVVWRVLAAAVDWFALRQDGYEPLPPGPDGVYRSEVFPGLWLDPAALIRGDMPAVGRVAQQGLAGPEHAAFVERLRRTAESQQRP
jgi:Uma2 family endonuclease